MLNGSKRIKKLPELVITQIAAGEIIERPSSVVKELVENSIDAGATKIYIYVEDGGKKKIIVTDNGTGIHKEDIPLMVERHATSKIEKINDLFEASTLGFRGEALASMASVSKVTIETSTEQDKGIGTRYIVAGDKVILEPTMIGRPRGTTIMIEELFFNIPARRKFLKSGKSELALISEFIGKMAMIYPEISFHLEQQGKGYIRTNGDGNQLHVISSIYGVELAKEMVPVSFENNQLKIEGYVSNVDGAKKTRKQQVVSVNKRIIKNTHLYESIEHGCRKYMPPGIYPVVVLNIELKANEIDCNAHPSKETVRLLNEEDINQLLEVTIRETLGEDKEETKPIETITEFLSSEMSIYEVNEAFKLNIIGQLQDMYILCEINEKFMIIDQHAAHEAILYYYFEESILRKRDTLPLVELPTPVVVELTPSQEVLFEQHKEDVSRLGFEVESFGHRSMIVRKAPKGIDLNQIKQIIQEVLADGLTNYNDWLKNALISTSCKSAIKAHDKLNVETMEYIVREIVLNQITNCPHGRPLFITTSIMELHKKFRRVL